MWLQGNDSCPLVFANNATVNKDNFLELISAMVIYYSLIYLVILP